MNTATTTPHSLQYRDTPAHGIPAAAIDLAGRSMLALIFILSGYSKIGGYEGTAAWMAAMGVPALLLPPTIALELLGGIALVLGYRIRLFALLLALFSLASAALFHADLSDQTQFIMFFKNIAMAGGLLLLTVQRTGPWTLDRRLGR